MTNVECYETITYYERRMRLWVAFVRDGNGDQVGDAGYGTTKDAAVRERNELYQEVI